MVIVALPAYNEQQALPPLLETMKQVRQTHLPDLRVIVVDDGSTDSTADVAKAHSKAQPWISLIRHEHNRGLSQAIQTGFETALKEAKPGDVIVTLDADNTQSPDTIPGMLARLAEGYDVVVASRFQPGAQVFGVPRIRQLYSRVMSLLFQLALFVPGIRDYSCGFRAYRAETLMRAYDRYGAEFITERGFACMVEILLQLDNLGGVTFAEVPFILRYDLKPTPSKMNVRQTIADTLRLAVRYRLGRIARRKT
jgi:dolichol-phosphate mannosyltransferase